MSKIKHLLSKVVHFFKTMDKNTALAGIAVIGVIIAGVLIYANSNPNFMSKFNLGFGADGKAIAQKSVDYINNNGLSQTKVELSGDVTTSSGLFKFKIKIGANEYDTYATKDGKMFFPQAFVMEKETAKTDAAKTDTTADTTAKDTQKPENITKSDSPMLEAYVVSRCPFGLQMHRIMADAVKNIPELGKYIKSMYMGSVSSDGKTITAMHGEAEAAENLRQICIREEQPAKYWDYIACQMKKAGTEVACEKSTGVDSAKLSSCISDTSRGIAFAKKDFELNTKYNVTGSPTLILNEKPISEFDFGGRSSDAIKTMVCDSFNAKPGFCSTKLNTESAAASFSETYSSGTAAAAPAANCATAQ